VALGVATLGEAIGLRESGVRGPIWVFSDVSPWSDTMASLVERYAITPILHDRRDVQAALQVRYRKLWKRRSFHVKFNTGMNRLGVAMSDAGEIARGLNRAGVRPGGVCTHFASAESVGGAVTRAQTKKFAEVLGLIPLNASSHIHCANTAAILSARSLDSRAFGNVVRPGIGLYGYGGTAGGRLGLKPALTWTARVLSARKLERGAVVGYGATFRARGGERQAILAVGYGDGFRRGLSGERILIEGRETRVLGRVSMDLASLELKSHPGAWVRILGRDSRQGERLAQACGTIVYEILTGISARVPRIYE
jgi:alanine racemase